MYSQLAGENQVQLEYIARQIYIAVVVSGGFSISLSLEEAVSPTFDSVRSRPPLQEESIHGENLLLSFWNQKRHCLDIIHYTYMYLCRVRPQQINFLFFIPLELKIVHGQAQK